MKSIGAERKRSNQLGVSRRMRCMKKLGAVLLAFSMLLTVLAPALAVENFSDNAVEQQNNGSLDNFSIVNSYVPGQFKDVDEASWYASSVKAVYEYGLMQGSSSTQFNPNGNITIAEAIVLSSRLHSVYYNDNYTFIQGTPWYDSYVQYAIENSIIEDGEFSNYDANATRAQFAIILAAAFPDEALTAINDVKEIPDLDSSLNYAPPIYKLYNAGVLTGNDAYGTFTPEASINRASVTAIVARMAVPSLRKKVTLEKKPVAATDVILSESEIILEVGDTFQLEATVIPENATNKTVTWIAHDDAISVSPTGLVTAISPTDYTYVIANAGFRVGRTCTVIVKKPTVKINLADNLPVKLYESDWNGNIVCSWLVNDFRYEVEENYDGTYDVDFYFSGEKTFDARGSGQGASCKISWQLIDEEGYVVESGTCFSPSVSTGEKFRDANDYLYYLSSGTYTLELSSTN